MDKDLTNIEQHIAQSDGELTASGLAEIVAVRAIERLVGSVSGRTVLDLSCGEGRLSRWLAVHGAYVTGVDSSVEVIEIAREREANEPHGISYLVSDAADLYMVDDSTFDDVICHLSLDHFENLSAVIAEVARIIRLGGRFIFSVEHPCFDSRIAASLQGSADGLQPDYFAEGMRPGLCGLVHHRTLAAYINAVAARGFTVRRIVEPTVEERDIAGRAEFAEMRLMPVALAVEAIFPHI